ncbi:RecB family exonuclease [Aciditerrimonas ferrireducens]|uniref:RecB family exonuclease n=1 Tax=Aciditerrimonas ferrireducens TaxID=667306 RepID=UPI0020051E34|nr:PD-(D/E)XK nuclease family protein [Aciditerrimonas ferrireducens]MCK4177906.1 PD-(D/E)XK nuclease family protein [Aciditerrimonas ferrireducens]
MPLAVPRSLTPSKVEAFGQCPLAFRFRVLDHLPEPPTRASLLGTLVHRSLELLFWERPAGQRTPSAEAEALEAAWAEPSWQASLAMLALPDDEQRALRAEAAALVGRLRTVENPDAADVVGVELTVEAPVEGVRLRGVIDRLDRQEDGRLVVVDYKTGRVPPASADQARLAGVRLYALLVEQVLGVVPAAVRLVYLRGPVVVESPVDQRQTVATRRRTLAVWAAIERACEREDFRPRPSVLCRFCAFRDRCPAQGAHPLSASGSASAQPPLPGV